MNQHTQIRIKTNIPGRYISLYRLSAYGMFLFYLLLPFEYPLQTIGVGSILRYVGILTMVFAFADLLLSGQKIRIDYRTILLLIWCAYAIVSRLWCVNAAMYRYYISIYINNALMFLAVTLVPYTEDEVRFIEKGLIGGIILLLAYMTFVPGAVVASSWQSRLTLAYKGKELLDQNYLAALMVMPYGILLHDLIAHRKLRLTKAIICLVIFYYILRTGSRCGLLGIGAITVLMFFREAKRQVLIVIIAILILLVVGPLIVATLPEDLLDRYSWDAMIGNTSESGGRLEVWAIAWDAIKQGSALWGYGAGASEMIVGLKYSSQSAIHNFVIAHVVELGLLGLGLFLAFLIKMFKELVAGKQYRIYLSFVGIVVVAMLLDVLTTKFFWAALMILTLHITAGRTSVKKTAN